MASPEVSAFALDVERQAQAWADHAHIAELFGKSVDLLAEEDSRRQFILWEHHLFRYHLSSEEPDKGLVQFLVMEGRAYPPPAEEFPPEEGVGYFEQRLAQAAHPTVRARLADFLWLRRKKFTFAERCPCE